MADTDDLLARARAIWGALDERQRLSLDEVAVDLLVVAGDIARIARSTHEKELDPDFIDANDLLPLAKELGNLLLSVPRWIEDLGISPELCLRLADAAQRSYVERLECERMQRQKKTTL